MPDSLLGGSWNMLRDRNDDRAAARAIWIMDEFGLDFLCLQEAAEYVAALREASGEEYDVLAVRGGSNARRESIILARHDLEHGAPWSIRVKNSWWTTVRGGRAANRHLTAVVLDGWLPVVSGHTPPSVRWRSGDMFGPARRVLSMRRFARRVRGFLDNHPHALVACDWNADDDARGRYTPHWIARKTGAEVVAPKHGTHGNRTIDYALVKGAHATARRSEEYGSDHRLVIFEVTR